MSWFKKHSVCIECGVHFEPVTGYESRWGNLCSIHRKPVMARDLLKDRVILWATANWGKLVEMMEKEQADLMARQAVFMNSKANQNNAHLHGALGGLSAFNYGNSLNAILGKSRG